MNFFNSTKRAAVLGIATGLLFAHGVMAQAADTAYVQFFVNVDANVLAELKEGAAVVTRVEKATTANTISVLALPLPKTSGVLFGAQRQSALPGISSNRNGKVAVNLSAQTYKNARIALYSVNGKRILSAELAASEAAKNISRRNVVSGVYLLSVKGTNGDAVTSRLTHGGGNLDISVTFGNGGSADAARLAKKAADGDWTITVSADGYADTVYAPKLVKGMGNAQIITLRPTYLVTVSSGTGGGNYTAGSMVTITAGTVPTGQIFQSWTTASGGVNFVDANSATTTFTMPANAVMVTAVFETASIPDVPSNMAAVIMSASSINVSWSSVSGATGYYVYRATSATGTYTKVGTTSSISYTNSYLTSALIITYCYKVSAYNSAGESPQSAYVSAVPSVPSSVAALAKATGNILVSWSASVPGATGYYLYRSTSTSGAYSRILTTSFSSEGVTSLYRDTGLTSGTTYYYKVSAYNANGESSLSSYAEATAQLPVATMGLFTDSRNSQTYNTVRIGNQTWMAENLKYTASGKCYNNDSYMCDMYGRLYAWEAAKTACPSGWHLPSRQEWGDLVKAIGGTSDYGTSGSAGKKLKSTLAWNSNGNGTDDYEFMALPGGRLFYTTVSHFDGLGSYGFWWTATEHSGAHGVGDTWTEGSAYYRNMNYGGDNVNEHYDDKSAGLSVRCVQND